MSSGLEERATLAYYRRLEREGHDIGNIMQPSRPEVMKLDDGKQYVVLRNVRGVLAVYRVRNDGVLKGLKRWPAELGTAC